MQETYPVRRHVHLSEGHAERLRQLAAAIGVTQSEMVRRLIDYSYDRMFISPAPEQPRRDGR